jgi:hypothetical protein
VIYSGVTALSLGLACVLMPALGTVGAALAVLAADGCMAGIVLRASLSRVQDTPSRFAASLLATPRFRQALPSALES